MAEYSFEKPTIEHCWYIAANMRQADQDEVAMEGYSPFDALKTGMDKSEFARTAIIDGDPAVMFGVGAPFVLGRTGVPWLLGTDAVRKVRKSFLIECRAHIEDWMQHYSSLENRVDARNQVSIRWLKWLGFEVKPAITVAGYTFHPFVMRAS